MDSGPQLKARIRFLPPNEGGRQTSALSGYKPALKIGEAFTSCFIWGDSREQVFLLDSEYDVHLELLLWDEYKAQLNVGMPIEFNEGGRIVAQGVITGILR